jgi:DNA repair exonuclease SbcCD ATPase subunit
VELKGLDEFLKIFGDITVLNIVEFGLACAFLWFVYKKVSNFLIQQHEQQKLKDEQLKEALDGVHKYPEYRKQSIEIQKELKKDIHELKNAQAEITKRLVAMEEENKRRERNKLRDTLLRNYRYYMNKETNPSQTWTRMESEAFWELFKDYEDAGGNGYMHSTVLPDMERLIVVEVGQK